MTFIRKIKYWSTVIRPDNPAGSWVEAELWRLNNGAYVVKVGDNLYLSIDTFGNYNNMTFTDPSQFGSWQLFKLNNGLNALQVTPDIVSYAIYILQNS